MRSGGVASGTCFCVEKGRKKERLTLLVHPPTVREVAI